MRDDLSRDFLKSLAAQADTVVHAQNKARQDRDAEERLAGAQAEQFGKKIFDFAEHLKQVPPDAQGRRIHVRRNSNQVFRHFLTLTIGPKDAEHENMRSSYPVYPELSVTIEKDRISASDASRRHDRTGSDSKSFKESEEALQHIGVWLVNKAPSIMRNIDAEPKDKVLPQAQEVKPPVATEKENAGQAALPKGIPLMQRLKIRKP